MKTASNSGVLRTIPLMLIMVLFCPLASGRVIYVDDDGQADFDNIQAGIDAADDGDTVLVAPGEYIITEPITFRGKAITVMSEAGRDETTIRMGTPADPNRGSVVVFENNETAAAVLDGFTITGGQGCRLWAAELSIFAWGGGGIILNASSGTVRNCAIVDNTSRDGGGGVICIGDKASVTMTNCTIAANLAGKVGSNAPTHVGGGVLVMEGCSATLTDCNITENSSGHAGGGVYCCFQSSSVTLTDCTIVENTTYTSGGGVMCYKSLVTLRDCVIAGNYSTKYGGGVSCETDASAIVINCIISGNSAAGMGGGGLFCWLISSVTLTNCTIWGNSAGQWGGGLGCFDGPSVAVTNSIISGNTAPMGREVSVRNPVTTLTVAYSGIAGGQAGVYVQGGSTLNWGEGNIDADPLFADPSNDDFHLKSEAGRWDPTSQTWVLDDVSSPCIDAGDPNSPTAFEPYPNGGIVNMGAYGGTGEASKSPSGLHAQYSGGSGTAGDPYQIATAEDLMLLGESPGDYDKHFILTADIDLNPYPFVQAVIPQFSGVFDGNGHVITHLRIRGYESLGLFGQTGPEAKISNLGLEAVDINGTGRWVGGLVGVNGGSITMSYSTGSVSGGRGVGGLVGYNDGRNYGSSITLSYSTGAVTGNDEVGGLVGRNYGSSITLSYSTGAVTGNDEVGGLVGESIGGGFVDYSIITASYSTGAVTGNSDVGGLVGKNDLGSIITSSIWDVETSGQPTSAGGTGLTTPEMQDINTYLNEGWDCADEVLNGICDYWQISPGEYPRLRYQDSENLQMPEGLGTAEQPYLIRDARDLGTVWFKPTAYYRLETSLDLSASTWSMAVVPWFDGVFEGNGHVISNLHIHGMQYLGLFGRLDSRAYISSLGLEAVDVNGTGYTVGGLVGDNAGSITSCYSTGLVTGDGGVGGLVGHHRGSITACFAAGQIHGESGNVGGLVGAHQGSITMSYSTGSVSGGRRVGGLVGYKNKGSITSSYSTGSVSGRSLVGGLVGDNEGSNINDGIITMCYCRGPVSGDQDVGGLVGGNAGTIANSYSTGAVTGNNGVGGLVGMEGEDGSIITSSFWDVETSGLSSSDGGIGKTTAEMQTASMFLQAGWDFVDEPANGTEDIWWILEGQDYPRLWWELIPEN